MVIEVYYLCSLSYTENTVFVTITSFVISDVRTFHI